MAATRSQRSNCLLLSGWSNTAVACHIPALLVAGSAGFTLPARLGVPTHLCQALDELVKAVPVHGLWLLHEHRPDAPVHAEHKERLHDLGVAQPRVVHQGGIQQTARGEAGEG